MSTIFLKQSTLTVLTISLFSLNGCKLYNTKYDNSSQEPANEEHHSTLTVTTDPISLKHRELANELLTYRQQIKASDVLYCQYFPMGYSTCGPARYIVYSTQGMSEKDMQELNNKVDEFNQLDAVQKSVHRIHAHCTAIPTPEVSLIDGSCRATNSQRNLAPGL